MITLQVRPTYFDENRYLAIDSVTGLGSFGRTGTDAIERLDSLKKVVEVRDQEVKA